MPSDPITIDDPNDPRIADYRDARDVELRGSRFTAQRFLIESEPVLRRALGSGYRIESMLLSPERFELLRDAIEMHEPEAMVYLLEDRRLREHAGYRHHHGVLAMGLRPDPGTRTVERWLEETRDRASRPTVLLEGITHVDNLGAFFRNAAAFGVRGVVLDGACTDPFFRKAIRFSMGHIFRVPWCIAPDWLETLHRLREEGMRLVAIESGVHAGPLHEMPRDQPPAFLFGNEGHGLPHATLNACDDMREIPMAPGVPSVNVATAGAIALYEWNRNGRDRSARAE